jgi:hypothetical protein
MWSMKTKRSSKRPPRRVKKSLAPKQRLRRKPKRPERKRRISRKTPRRARASSRRSEPRSAKAFFARSLSFQAQWKDMTRVVSKLREGLPFHVAVRDVDTNARTIVRLAGSALRRLKDGRYVVRAADRLLRVVYLPDDSVPGGLREVATRDSRQVTRVANYWHAVNRYVSTGEASGLLSFRRKAVMDAEGHRVPLLTDLATLNQLAEAGVLSFESVYVSKR